MSCSGIGERRSAWRARLRNRRGITLVELVTAMTLMVLLAAMGMGQLNEHKNAVRLRVVQSDLRNLATKQELFFSGDDGQIELGAEDWTDSSPTGGRYSDSLEELGFQPSPGVLIELRANSKGWAAKGSHEGFEAEGWLCTIFVGDEEPYEPASVEGEVSCKAKKAKKSGKDEKKDEGSKKGKKGKKGK